MVGAGAKADSQKCGEAEAYFRLSLFKDENPLYVTTVKMSRICSNFPKNLAQYVSPNTSHQIASKGSQIIQNFPKGKGTQMLEKEYLPGP